jgi:hypothetical protein
VRQAVGFTSNQGHARVQQCAHGLTPAGQGSHHAGIRVLDQRPDLFEQKVGGRVIVRSSAQVGEFPGRVRRFLGSDWGLTAPSLGLRLRA